jgi:hypothetical protein
VLATLRNLTNVGERDEASDCSRPFHGCRGLRAAAASAGPSASAACLATLGVSGVESRGTTNPICVDRRPISMTISNGYATIVYQDWKLHTLHYRGRVDPSGKIYLSHLNGDGSRSVFTLHPSPEGWNGDMRRGNCEYMIALARS